MPKKQRFEYVVCKPCWELKYCPYGPLVEFFPLYSTDEAVDGIRERYDEALAQFGRGEHKTEVEIMDMVEVLLFHRPWLWEEIREYDVSDLSCNVFGHVCPVFFNAEPFTETKEGRRPAGRYIPREVMLKVVRRDGQMCQVCHMNVPDNKLAIDHVIPVSRGGPSTVDNLRVLCSECNAKKSASLDEILQGGDESESSD